MSVIHALGPAFAMAFAVQRIRRFSIPRLKAVIPKNLSPGECTMWRFGDSARGSLDLTNARRWTDKLL
jgi:hypothetical protein